MSQRSIPAVYMRGGTSRALFFHRRDLPRCDSSKGCAEWDAIFTGALGSPDPNGRQLNGMGGGISSLSKIAVIGPATHPGADVDYTFAQVGVSEPTVGYRGNCGNISSAVGPFAVDEGLVPVSDGPATVRIHNTNTGKIIVAQFSIENGKAAVDGDFVLQGVAGSGAKIRLAFKEPGGATTGKLLPTGRVRDILEIPSIGPIELSLVDASNPVAFLRADAIGLTGHEMPDALEASRQHMAIFEAIRIGAAVKMGLVSAEEEARTKMKNLPLVALLAAPADTQAGGGRRLAKDDMDVLVRMISAGQPHKATPLTGAMCLAVAARLPGTIAHEMSRPSPDEVLRVANPSGVLQVAAQVRGTGDVVVADEAVVYRTARRLMEGRVLVP